MVGTGTPRPPQSRQLLRRECLELGLRLGWQGGGYLHGWAGRTGQGRAGTPFDLSPCAQPAVVLGPNEQESALRSAEC